MAVSDLYIVQYLLQATLGAADPLIWQMDEAGSYMALINGVTLALFQSHTMGWSGLCLRFTKGEDVIYVEEPRFSSLFRRVYKDDDEKRLAEAMRTLERAVAKQSHQRKERAWRLKDSVRESLYRLVLFGDH